MNRIVPLLLVIGVLCFEGHVSKGQVPLKKKLYNSSNIYNWLVSIPDSLTRYNYAEVAIESSNGKMVQSGEGYDWSVQLHQIDLKNGYISANGYLPSVGEYTPEEQFVIFKKFDGTYLFAYHYLDEYVSPASSLRFFETKNSYLYELPKNKVLPSLALVDFVGADFVEELKSEFSESELSKVLIVYYLPQLGTAIRGCVSLGAMRLNEELKKRIEAFFEESVDVNGHKLYGYIPLKWNRSLGVFKK